MSNLLVKIGKGEDDNLVVELGVNIQMTGTFRNGIVEQIGHRKMSKKFIDGVCKALVKQIQPQLLTAIKQEQSYYDHPETIPAPPEGVKPPPLNHALLGREPIEKGDDHPLLNRNDGEGAEGDPGVSEPDQKPDNSD